MIHECFVKKYSAKYIINAKLISNDCPQYLKVFISLKVYEFGVHFSLIYRDARRVSKTKPNMGGHEDIIYNIARKLTQHKIFF